jgi:hypothetical protein
MAGYAVGCGTAKLENGELAAAAKQLVWLVNEGNRYADAVGYPGAPRPIEPPRRRVLVG